MLFGEIVSWRLQAGDKVDQFRVGIRRAICNGEFILGVRSTDVEGEPKKLALFIDALPWDVAIFAIEYIFS